MNKLALMVALVLGGCSYRVVVVSDCDAGIVEGDAAVLEDAEVDAGADAGEPPCESECAYDTETGLLYYTHRALNEHNVCKSAAPDLCGEVCDVEIGCGPS